MSPLLPIAVSAAAPLAARAMGRLAEALPFANLLRGESSRSQSPADPPAASEGAPAADLAGPAAAARLHHARRMLHETADRFRRELQRRLAQAGIDPSGPISLESNGRGAVLVGGEHPQWAAIERIFAEDPALTELFHRLLAEHQLLRRLEAPETGSPRATQLRVVLDGDRLDVQES